jgi:hypothetical protein
MFQKATKEAAKLRAALFGPSGAGKTFTALRLATGIGGPIAVIDSERGTASKYADRFDFDVANLPSRQHTIKDYVEAITAAGTAGYNVLIIDSMTHAWQELLTEIDAIAKAKYRGNTWSAWSEGTPKQKALIDAILDFPGHVIATMRSKTEWSTEQTNGGKSKPVRVGLTPEQGKGIEYEFDMLFELTTEHMLTVLKDRSGKFQDQIIEKPGEELGKAMASWLDEGAPPLTVAEQIMAKARAVGLTELGRRAMLCQCTGSADGTLDGVKPAIQQHILNQALNTAGIIQSWNAGVDSRTGAVLPLDGPALAPVAAVAAAPEPVAADPEPDADPADPDPEDLPALWAA